MRQFCFDCFHNGGWMLDVGYDVCGHIKTDGRVGSAAAAGRRQTDRQAYTGRIGLHATVIHSTMLNKLVTSTLDT